MTMLYTFAHFAVDFSCAYLIFGISKNFYASAALMLVYNFCAFALQMPLGIIFDKLNRNFLGAAIGCQLTGASLLLGNIPFAATVICGIGNAAFHLGGGIDVLNYSDKGALCGVYVSSGAVGLFLGMVCAKSEYAITPIVITVLCFIAAFIVVMQKNLFGKLISDNVEFSPPKLNTMGILAILALFIVVMLRSFTGFGMSFSWKSGMGAFAGVLATAAGKFIGGFAADRLGTKKAAILSLCAAAMLFIISNNIFFGLAAILLFNITMPITLKKAADICCSCKGFSFGLMTFAIFCGFIPVYLHKTAITLSPFMLSAISVISLIILIIALHYSKDGAK